MTTVLTEGGHAAGFLISEANHYRSRETVIISAGQVLKAGAVLGKISAGGHYRAFDNALSDGAQTAAAILIADVDTTVAEKEAAVIVRDAEVNAAELVWATGIDSGEAEAAAVTLRTLGIVTR